jgi:hypothetical protein
MRKDIGSGRGSEMKRRTIRLAIGVILLASADCSGSSSSWGCRTPTNLWAMPFSVA